MTKLQQLAELGQSVWYDNIQRGLLDSGELQALVEAGVRGITSNPTIFEKAILGSSDYDKQLESLAKQGRSATEIFEALAIEDIRRAADLLRPVYDQTAAVDGYVSLEVNPKLAHDTQGTIAEARRLFATVERPNIFIKVPATPAGIPAIETLIAEGINTNVTLMFSLDHYDVVSEAYISGLERRAAAGGGLSRVASVASFFVSRVDTAVDRALDEVAQEDLAASQTVESLKGKIAIANTKMTYECFRQVFAGPRWEGLVAQGARVQRPLWASTSTKNPAYDDTMYVDALVGPDTVNTMPQVTIEAVMDHGTVAPTLEHGWGEARAQLAALAELGIDLDAITEQVQDEGVAAFARSFESLIESVEQKRAQLQAREGSTVRAGA